MPFSRETGRSGGISLPPSGWTLTLLLLTYIFAGLIGHDPWKHDDAISIGIAYDIVAHGNWLTPELAGQYYPDAPLYYWTAAITAHLFSWLLPLHDAARLASGIYTLLALEFILLAARTLYGRPHSAAAPLVLAGSIGFLFHAHEAQPMLAALAAHTAAYWALTLLHNRPRLAMTVLGTAIAACFLTNGILPVLTLLPVILIAWITSNTKKPDAINLLLATLFSLLLCGFWLIPLALIAPQYLSDFFNGELSAIAKPVDAAKNILHYAGQLLWYAWPSLPLAAWAIWSKRRTLNDRPFLFPTLAFLSLLILLGSFIELRSAVALLLLPPLALLAVPGVSTLRRGAANAFDWFGMMTFSFFALVAWIIWSAMVFGWPERLARQVVRLEPGFVGHFGLVSFAIALLATLAWFFLIATTQRSNLRGIMHWMTGLTLFWLLVVTLWMPWLDYGKTYRPVSAALAKVIPANVRCIANGNLSRSILASLDYFNGIRTFPLNSPSGKRCNWLLVHGEPKDPSAITAAGWRKVWEGKRPGDRRGSDKFHLYRRSKRSNTPGEFPDLPVDEPEALMKPLHKADSKP